MFKDTRTDAVANVVNPKSFLDLFTLAYINCTSNISKDENATIFKHSHRVEGIRKNGGLKDIEIVEFECNEELHSALYKHLTDPETCFRFLETEATKRFFVASTFAILYYELAQGFFANDQLASIIASVINVPLEKLNNNRFKVADNNFDDIDLFDPQFGDAYRRFFGTNCPNYLREHDVNSTAIKFKKVDPNAVLPTKKRRSDTGLDITVIKKVKTDNWGNEWYDTGLQLEVPPGYYTELYGRSSLIKKGWQLANCTGIIDETYRNNLMCVFTRLHPDAPSLEVELPNRACQLVLRQHEKAHAVEVNSLSNTDRDKGGFGSTGL